MLVSLDQIFKEYIKIDTAITDLKNDFENITISREEYLTKKEQIEKDRIVLYKNSLMTVNKFIQEKLDYEFTQYRKIEFSKAHKTHSTMIKKTRQECILEAEELENLIEYKKNEQIISEEDSIKLFRSVTLMKEYYLAGLPVSSIKFEQKKEKHEIFLGSIKYGLAFYLLWFSVSTLLMSYTTGNINDISQYTFQNAINSNTNSFIVLLSEIFNIFSSSILIERIDIIIGLVLTAYVYEVILIISLIYLIESLVNKTPRMNSSSFTKFFIGYLAYGIVNLICEITYSLSKGSICEIITNISNNIYGDFAIYMVTFVVAIVILVIKISVASKIYKIYTSKYQI